MFTRQNITFSQLKDFPINPNLPISSGLTEEQLFNFVTSVRVEDAPEEEMRNYGTHDFKRFVYT